MIKVQTQKSTPLSQLLEGKGYCQKGSNCLEGTGNELTDFIPNRADFRLFAFMFISGEQSQLLEQRF